MRKLFKNLTKQQIEIGLYALVIAVLIVGAAMLLWSTGGVWSKLWQLVCAVVEPLAYGAMLAYVFNPIVTHVSHALKCSPRLAD